jgi:hypothetical protein
MSNKNITGLTYLRNASLRAHTTPTDPYNITRHQSSNYQRAVKKSSLVFLSTLMQIEKSNMTLNEIDYQSQSE